MISAPAPRNSSSSRSPSASCDGSSGRREEALAAVLRPAVGAVEADEVIDAVAVEEIGAAARALAQPAEVFQRHDVPSIERHAPVLPGRAERVGRRADRHVEAELLLARPHVGAVAVDHERQIAEQRDAVRVLARVLPLRAGEPLQVLMEQHLVGKLAARAIDRRRLAALQLDRPLGPRPLVLAHVERAEEAVVLDPPRLLAGVRAQRPRARGVAPPLGLEEALERGAQRRVFQAPDGPVIDARRAREPRRARRDRRATAPPRRRAPRTRARPARG